MGRGEIVVFFKLLPRPTGAMIEKSTNGRRPRPVTRGWSFVDLAPLPVDFRLFLRFIYMNIGKTICRKSLI